MTEKNTKGFVPVDEAEKILTEAVTSMSLDLDIPKEHQDLLKLIRYAQKKKEDSVKEKIQVSLSRLANVLGIEEGENNGNS